MSRFSGARQVIGNLLVGFDNTLTLETNTKGWTQQEAARQLGVSQPRISEICRGKIGLFTVDKLINMLARAGQQVTVQILEEAV